MKIHKFQLTPKEYKEKTKMIVALDRQRAIQALEKIYHGKVEDYTVDILGEYDFKPEVRVFTEEDCDCSEIYSVIEATKEIRVSNAYSGAIALMCGDLCIGMSAIYAHPGNPYDFVMFIRPGFRGEGLSQVLIEATLDELRQYNEAHYPDTDHPLHVQCTAIDHKSAGALEKAGFVFNVRDTAGDHYLFTDGPLTYRVIFADEIFFKNQIRIEGDIQISVKAKNEEEAEEIAKKILSEDHGLEVKGQAYQVDIEYGGIDDRD